MQSRRPGFDPWVEKIPWRREWLPTPVFFGELCGQRSLVGYSPWGRKESDTTERLHTHTHIFTKMFAPPSAFLEKGSAESFPELRVFKA